MRLSIIHWVLSPLAPALAIPILAAPPRLQFYRWLVWGQPRPVQAKVMEDQFETERHCFQVIPAPGHCSDQVCLLERSEGWLFSGDLFIAERARYARADEDVQLSLDSLRRMLALYAVLRACWSC